MLLLKQRTIYGDYGILEEYKPILLVPYPRFNLSQIKERIEEAHNKSSQLAILLGLYYYCKRNPKGAKPKDLHDFLNRLGISIKDNYLRAELSYLLRKGLVIRQAGRYKVREDIKLSDIELMIDLRRVKAGRARWVEPKHWRDWIPKHSLDPKELLQKYNVHNLREHIKALIRKDEVKALAALIVLGGGLRPSDRLVEVGYRDGKFYAIVYEPKCSRYRLICEEYDELWHELLKDEEVRRWLLELVRRHGEGLYGEREYRWRLSDADWMRLSLCLKKKEKRLARRIYLAHQPLGGQAAILSLKDSKPIIIGMHLDISSDEYYIMR